MLFVDFLDAKYGMAEAMDTLIGGPEPFYSRTPHRLDGRSANYAMPELQGAD
jgi:hypothetical protein